MFAGSKSTKQRMFAGSKSTKQRMHWFGLLTIGNALRSTHQLVVYISKHYAKASHCGMTRCGQHVTLWSTRHIVVTASPADQSSSADGIVSEPLLFSLVSTSFAYPYVYVLSNASEYELSFSELEPEPSNTPEPETSVVFRGSVPLPSGCARLALAHHVTHTSHMHRSIWLATQDPSTAAITALPWPGKLWSKYRSNTACSYQNFTFETQS
jgi:hypothetical protein